MNAELLHAAEKIVSNNQILVNVVRLRVRQLTLGHRPLVVAPPGSGTADIALMEVIQNKIGFASTVEPNDVVPLPAIVEFPDMRSKKKAA